MRLLLDTQIFLWWLADSRKLAKATRERIEAADEVYVSAASIVECEQKISAGLLEADAHGTGARHSRQRIHGVAGARASRRRPRRR